MLLFPNERVESYFEQVDGRDPREFASGRIARAYENGQAILLKGLTPDFDRKFVAQVDVSAVARLKKLKSVAVAAHHERLAAGGDRMAASPPANSPAAQYESLLSEVFGGDGGRFDYFVQQMRIVNTFLEDCAARIFPTYRYVSTPITWRLSTTINENLHLDVYNDDLPDHHVRMFVNLDDTHRIWHTSHRLDWLLEHHLRDLEPEFVRNASAGRICHALNFKVFGGFDVAGREGADKHICFFEPGEVWLVDSRKVSHQIFYGRRAVSTDYQVDPTSMLDPAQHYFAVVERYRERCARVMG